MKQSVIFLLLLAASRIYAQSTTVMPEFPGGQNALLQFLKENIKYPEQEKKNGVEGRVVVRFMVSETGEVLHAVVVKSVSPGLDAEALRVVSRLPEFKPGTQNGVPVQTYFTLPVLFKLSDKQNQAGNGPGYPADSTFIEHMPEFPGGDKELMNFLRANIKYPAYEMEANIQGKVLIRFTVSVTGEVQDAMIVKGLSPGLDAEALRVVRLLPKFKPGTQNGVPVPVFYNMPFTFKITDHTVYDTIVTTDTIWQVSPAPRDEYSGSVTRIEQPETDEKPFGYTARRNAIKIDILSPISGSFLFLYERKLAHRFGLEIGIGPTFRNAIYESFSKWYNTFNMTPITLGQWQGQPNTYDVNDNFFNYTYRSCTSGFAAVLSPRIYVWGEGLGGLYVAPMATYALTTYKYMHFNQQYLRDKTKTGTEMVQLIKPTLNLGYQFAYHDFCIETMIGGGVAIENSKREDTGIDIATDTYINGMRNINRILPEITMTLRIGFLFGANYDRYSYNTVD